VLTRDVESTKAKELQAENPSIKLLQGSYSTEKGLRKALANQDVAYFTIDSFSVGEPQEYFWTFRAYEIALQSGLQWFIYSGAKDRFEGRKFEEKYRNSHNVVAGRLSSWLASQPVERLPWTIIQGGIYAEMLQSLLQPIHIDQKLVFKAPVRESSVMPLIPLQMYGARVAWALEHPQESFGKYLSAGPFQVTYPEIAHAMEHTTGKNVKFESISIGDWMTGISAHLNPDNTLPRGSDPNDPTTFTFRQSFGAWWNIWNDNEKVEQDLSWADEVYPDRPKTLEEWIVQRDLSKTSQSFTK
jgi:hypothetical protein